MTRTSGKKRILVRLAAVVLLLQSCITDEFRVKDISFDPNLKIDVVAPIFKGDMEFRDFIHDWATPIPDLPGSKTILDYSNRQDVTIPTGLILDHTVIIDDFPFLVQGSYSLSDIKLIFKVTNSCPLPLNLQFQFYHYNDNNSSGGTPILPPSFKEADFTANPVIPETSIYTVSLTDQQTEEFNNGKRVRITAWYDDPHDFLIQNNILSAHYPVIVSVVLNGKARLEYEK